MLLRSGRKSGQPAATIDVLPNELVVDILSRLPGKQIGICKCVCKPWRSTIRSRPFRDTYRKKNSGLLLNYRTGDRRHLRFFHCPLRRQDEPPGDFSPLTHLDLLMEEREKSVTELLDGMLCSYTNIGFGNPSSVSGLTLHNICTGENMRIPDPVTCADTLSTYSLGYDGVSRVYKLLRLIFKRLDFTILGAHIMTLRPSSGPPSTWRELTNCGLPSDLDDTFRVTTCSDDGLRCWMSGDESVAWFDLNNERFRLVELPEDVKCGKKNVLHAVTRLKGSLALWISSEHSAVNASCYVQEDEEGKKWRISKEIELSEGFTFAGGIFPSSSEGEMFGMDFDGTGRILSYSHRQTENETDNEEEGVFVVGNLPAGNLASNDEISCLGNANNLYLPLDEVLGGSFV